MTITKKQSEKEIEQSILYWLNYQLDCFAFTMDVKGTWNERGRFFQKVGKFTPRGASDVVGLIRSHFFCLEIKTPTAYKKFFTSPGEHELRQQAFLHQVRSKGGFAEVVCSLDQAQTLYKKWALLTSLNNTLTIPRTGTEVVFSIK